MRRNRLLFALPFALVAVLLVPALSHAARPLLQFNLLWQPNHTVLVQGSYGSDFTTLKPGHKIVVHRGAEVLTISLRQKTAPARHAPPPPAQPAPPTTPSPPSAPSAPVSAPPASSSAPPSSSSAPPVAPDKPPAARFTPPTGPYAPPAAPAAPPAAAPAPPSAPPSTSAGSSDQQLLQAINADRAAHGVAPLALDANQSACSLQHSQHMAAMGAISHDQFPGDICVSHTAAGENVGEASGTADAVLSLHQQMMAEGPCPDAGCPNGEFEVHGHYMNIVNPAFTRVGIGIYVQNGTAWLTEDFIG